MLHTLKNFIQPSENYSENNAATTFDKHHTLTRPTKMIYLRSLLYVVVSFTLLSCTSIKRVPYPEIQEKQSAIDYVSQVVSYEMQKFQLAGISVAVVDGKETLWQSGFGWSNIKQREPIQSSTLMRAGSLAKIINAIAILQLAEHDLLDLDMPVQQYVGEFKVRTRFPHADAITLRHLLTHQSGLPSDWISGMWRAEPSDFRTVVNYLSGVYVSQAPNTSFAYSNVAHDLIALVIEHVSQQPYERYIQERIFSPLNMDQSSLSVSPRKPPTAQSYLKNKALNELSVRDVPAAGLTTSAHDFANLVNLLLTESPDILGPSSREQLFRDYTSSHPLNVGKRFGLSLHFYDDVFSKNIRVFGHDGATIGQRALFKFSPYTSLGVVVFSNSKNAKNSLHRIANSALRSFYQVKNHKTPPWPYVKTPVKRHKDSVSPQELTGFYATPIGLAEIVEKNAQLYAKLLGKKFKLQHKPNSDLLFLHYKLLGLFNIDLGYYGSLGLSSRTIDDTQYLIGTNSLQNKILVGTAIEPHKIPPAWQARLGRYRVVNRLEAIDLPSGGLKIENGFLIAYAKTEDGQALEFVLIPQNDTQAIVAGVGRGLGETVFVEIIDGQEKLKFADIYFEKQPYQRKKFK